MKTPLLYVENHTSLSRIGMLFRLYMPALKRGFILYPIAVILLAFACGLIMKVTGSWPMMLFSIPFTVMFVCSPCVITRRDYRAVSAQLPVTAGEKLGFLMLNFMVIYPLLLWVSAEVSYYLVQWTLGIDVMAIMREQEVANPCTIATGMLMVFGIIAITMYYTFTARGNRTGACILSAFVTYLVFMFMLGIVMVCIGFYEGFKAAQASPMPEEMIDEETIMMLTRHVQVICAAVFTVAAAIYLRKLYKRLRNSGF